MSSRPCVQAARYLALASIADVAAVHGSPPKDISVMEHAAFVMKNGVICKAPDGVRTTVAQ